MRPRSIPQCGSFPPRSSPNLDYSGSFCAKAIKRFAGRQAYASIGSVEGVDEFPLRRIFPSASIYLTNPRLGRTHREIGQKPNSNPEIKKLKLDSDERGGINPRRPARPGGSI